MEHYSSSKASTGSIEATSFNVTEQSADEMVTELTTLPSQAGQGSCHTFHIIVTYLIVNTYIPTFHRQCFKIEGFNDRFEIILYKYFANKLQCTVHYFYCYHTTNQRPTIIFIIVEFHVILSKKN